MSKTIEITIGELKSYIEGPNAGQEFSTYGLYNRLLELNSEFKFGNIILIDGITLNSATEFCSCQLLRS